MVSVHLKTNLTLGSFLNYSHSPNHSTIEPNQTSHLEPGPRCGPDNPDSRHAEENKVPPIYHAQNNIHTGIVSSHQILMTLGLETLSRPTSQRQEGRPRRGWWCLVTKQQGSKTAACSGPQATHASIARHCPHAEEQADAVAKLWPGLTA